LRGKIFWAERCLGLEKFLAIFKNALDVEEGAYVALDSKLEELDGWDSLGKFSLISSVYDKYGVAFDPKELNAAVTVMDLWKAVEISRTANG
jgi:acyl carrier protein